MRRLRLRVAVVLVACAAASGVVLQSAGPLGELEHASVDARFAVRGEQAAPPDVVVVGLDERSLTELRTSYPLPRRLHAHVIDRLHAAGASTIAYDVQFTTPGPRGAERDDELLVEALERAAPVLLATTGIDARGRTEVLGGGEALDYSRAVPAAAQFPHDRGGTIRRMEAEVRGVPTLAVAAAALHRRERPPRTLPGGGTPWIDFAGGPGRVRTLSFADVVRGRFDPRAVRGKVVVVGASAPALQDTHLTSTARDELMSGPEVQANAVATALAGWPLRSVPAWLAVVLAGLVGALPAALATGARMSAGALRGAAVLVLWLVVAQVLFAAGTVVPVAAPTVAGLVALVAAVALGGLLAAFERQRLRDAFRRFVPADVVDRVMEGDLQLGGVDCEATVLFSDLRGFTTFSQGRPPAEVLGILNQYLGAMTEELHAEGGTVIAYMGDGIMAVFGAPVAQDDHAVRAVRAARRMIARLEELNAGAPAPWPATPLLMGVGINTGPVCAGQIGSSERLEYTAIGDTVNSASRIEGMTKQTGFAINLAGSTRDRLEDPDEPTFIGCLELRGRDEPVDLWGLLPVVPNPLPRVHPAVPEASGAEARPPAGDGARAPEPAS